MSPRSAGPKASPTPFSAIVLGGGAGFGGALLAHVLTVLADRAGAEQWLRGPWGPQFVPIALYTGVFYAALGAAAGRKASAAALGFLGPFLGIVVPMMMFTRSGSWGMPRGADGTAQWQLAVTLVYAASIWGTIAALGALCGATKRWRGALAAVAGSFLSYMLLKGFLAAVPSYGHTRWNPVSLVPSPVNLMDGLLSGACLCLALALDAQLRRKHEDQDARRSRQAPAPQRA